ncbi:MAG: translation initiation factor IF-2 [Holosporaceae bacterium]|jgi:translation initiation factor IF-2|nr:translation initiation factor IF-2 [Holosporaceae bacterium]
MTEQKKGTLSLSRPTDVKKNTVDVDGKIRQSFSHGKTKVVAVEVKKKRLPLASSALPAKKNELYKSGNLTDKELEARIKVVQDAMREEKEQAELRLKKEEEARQRLLEEEAAAAAAPKIIEEPPSEPVSASGEPAAAVAGEDSAGARKAGPKTAASHEKQPPSKNFKRPYSKGFIDDEEAQKVDAAKKTVVVKKDIRELKGKYAPGSARVSIYNAFDEEERQRTRSLSSIKRARQKNKFQHQALDEQKVIREVILPETISVQELSSRMAVRTGDVVKALMKLGLMVTANYIIDADTAEILVLDFGHRVKRVSEGDVEIGLKQQDQLQDMLPRPPVVTIMGHVDHGKTSLLDAIRKTDIVAQEAGGITQRIGAYQVTLADGRYITFIDTPGHAAFTEMRSRGANVTDVVVLVVAADDSVNDQTIEAINHAKAAGVPIVVAINKMDKPGANPDNVRRDLLNHEVVVESFGGDVMNVEISAKTGLNLDRLEEIILLQAEMLDLKANPHRSAEGIIIESRVEKGYGPVATVLIQKGTLKIGDVFVSGSVYGRVKAIKNYHGKLLNELAPGSPGEIVGFNGNTIPGEDFIVVGDEAKAREISGYRDRKKREYSMVISSRGTVEQAFSRLDEEKKLQALSVVVKTDVQGSSEAICGSLQKLSTSEVAIRILHSGIGEVTESDVALARASNAVIFGFNVRANPQARDQIARDKLQVRYYSVIYDLIDDAKALLSGLLAPDVKENVLGSAEVRRIFEVSKFGKIAGCMVLEGMMKRNAKVRLMRNGIVVHSGEMRSIRRVKDDVKEVKAGFECGISLENYNDIHQGDIIECFELEEVVRQL